MYSNFEFLREVNRDLYELGRSIEQQVYTAPSAVLCEGTTFLDNIVVSIFENENMTFNPTDPFWENCEKLGSSNAISDSFKRYLIKTFNQRNRMHGKIKSAEDYLKGNKAKAISMAKALVNCGWYYFQYLGNINAIKPKYVEIKDLDKEFVEFGECIICGEQNQPGSFFCHDCNEIFTQSNNVNFFAEEYGYFNTFKAEDLGPKGYSAEDLEEILPKLVSKNLLIEVNGRYIVNRSENNKLRVKVEELKHLENIIKKYHYGELSLSEIKESEEYKKGKAFEEPFVNFYNYIHKQAEDNFIKECKTDKPIEAINRSKLLTADEIENLVFENSPSVVNKLKEEFVRFVMEDKSSEEIKSNFNITDEVYLFLEMECGNQLGIFKAKRQFTNDLLGGESYEVALKNSGLTTDLVKEYAEIDEEFNSEIKKAESKRRNLLLTTIQSKGISTALDVTNLKKSDLIPLFGEEICIQIRNVLKYRYLSLVKDNVEFDDALEACEITKNQVDSWAKEDTSFKSELKEIKSFRLLNLLLKGNSLKKALSKVDISMDEFKTDLLQKEEFKKLVRGDKSLLADSQLKFSFKNLVMLNKSREDIKSKLDIDDEMYCLLEDMLANDLTQIKKNQYLAALNTGNTYDDALDIAGITKEDLKIFRSNDLEFKKSCNDIFESRKGKFIESLEENGFRTAFEVSKLTQKQLDKLFEAKNSDSFYKTVNNILKEKYHKLLQKNHNSEEALELCQVDETWLENWMGDVNFKNQVGSTGFDVLLTLLKNGSVLEDALKHTDISIKEFNNSMIDAFKGEGEYDELFEVYLEKVVPTIFNNFLNEFSDNNEKAALKSVNLDENIFKHFIENNSNHYDTYLKAKKCKYIKIAPSKGHNIALSKSELSADEFLDSKDELLNAVEQRKRDIVIYEIENNNKNPGQAVSKLDLKLVDVYNWYIDGMSDAEEFKEFASDFERVFIKPMVKKAFTYMEDFDKNKNQALKMLKDGISPRGGMSIRNFDQTRFKQSQRLGRINIKRGNKNIKTMRLSNEDFKFWKELNILDNYDECSLDLENSKETDMASC